MPLHRRVVFWRRLGVIDDDQVADDWQRVWQRHAYRRSQHAGRPAGAVANHPLDCVSARRQVGRPEEQEPPLPRLRQLLEVAADLIELALRRYRLPCL